MPFRRFTNSYCRLWTNGFTNALFQHDRRVDLQRWFYCFITFTSISFFFFCLLTTAAPHFLHVRRRTPFSPLYPSILFPQFGQYICTDFCVLTFIPLIPLILSLSLMRSFLLACSSFLKSFFLIFNTANRYKRFYDSCSYDFIIAQKNIRLSADFFPLNFPSAIILCAILAYKKNGIL